MSQIWVHCRCSLPIFAPGYHVPGGYRLMKDYRLFGVFFMWFGWGILAHAVPVETSSNGVLLRGELTEAVNKNPALLLVHGTLAHHEMELIKTLQILLEELGVTF